MGTSELRKEIHEYIDRADDRFLRLVYTMVENEQMESGSDLFSASDEDIMKRAESSLLSIKAGRTRGIHVFKKEIDSWKKHQSTR